MQGIVFIGLQASGKSSFYLERFYKTHIRLNLDMLKTRRREDILLQACLEAKQPVVIDNTNPTRKDRAGYIEAFKGAGFTVIGYYFCSGLEACLMRNRGRTGQEKIPEAGVIATYNRLEPPVFDEGFDRLYSVNIEGDGFSVTAI